MDTRVINNQFLSHLEDAEYSPENIGDSPRPAVSNDTKIASTSSPKRSRRAIQKRVVSVPIKDVEGFRLKGDQISAPPSDSWAWRKYGQKPIKGSPYPRGYYRCSSSKGCPARKQVERSRSDPTMLLVTYSCEHNHAWPASRNHHHNNNVNNQHSSPVVVTTNVTTTSVSEEDEEEEEELEEKKPIITNNQLADHRGGDEIINVSEFKFSSLGDQGPLIQVSEFGWSTDFETMVESPILTEDRICIDKEMAMIFTMREEDESFFGDLGELPECSIVFRRGMAQREAEQRRHGLAATTS